MVKASSRNVQSERQKPVLILSTRRQGSSMGHRDTITECLLAQRPTKGPHDSDNVVDMTRKQGAAVKKSSRDMQPGPITAIPSRLFKGIGCRHIER